MPSGGTRQGAGRPRKADKHARPIAAAEKRIVDRLPALIDDLLFLAHGQYEQVHEEWQPAGIVTTGSGEFETQVYPHLPPDELVLVKRTRTIAAPDRAANIYLVDRIMGKPAQRQELTGKDGGPLTLEYINDWRDAQE